MFSHHSHSGQFCKHASGTLQDVVREAIRKGFIVYGLTEHVPRYRMDDLYPEEKDISLEHLSETFDAFIQEAHRLKELHADRIMLLVGLETEFITDADMVGLERVLGRHGNRIEYLVGSVHHANSIPIDFDLPTFEHAVDSFTNPQTSDHSQAVERLFVFYFDKQYDLMRRFHPEVIGHFDLCRLYRPALRFQDYPLVWGKIERNVRYAIEYGALFELNAAAFRKGWDDAYPGSDVIQCIIKFGGRFTLSDDSHGPHAVGLNYHRLRDYVQRVGLKELWCLGHGERSEVSGRCLVPIVATVDWSNTASWAATSFTA
ncbi:histidinol phosphate phosphatase H [Gautieria morchelliformis]|nr:histidinol phosphate phosphatase H [Gautieria morchelliformis]